MPFLRAAQYYKCITVIEAEQNLVRMNIGDYSSGMKNDARRKFYRKMSKLARPEGSQEYKGFEQLAKKYGRVKNG